MGQTRLASISRILFFTIVLVFFVTGCVTRFTLIDALGSVATLSSAGGPGAVNMVFTGRDGVGPATCRQTSLTSNH